jgi:rhodanese-related sulfurtransferase
MSTIFDKIALPTDDSNREVTFDDVEAIIAANRAAAAAEQQQPVLVIDTRSRAEYAAMHLDGAICIPFRPDDEFSKAFDPEVTSDAAFAAKYGVPKPAEKDAPIVLFCHSGYRAGKCLEILQQRGYTHGKRWEGGHREMAWAQLPAEMQSLASVHGEVDHATVTQIVASPLQKCQMPCGFRACLILDVRSRDEVKSDGCIPGSVNIPMAELDGAIKMILDEDGDAFSAKYGTRLPVLSQPILTVCWAGMRAELAAGKLRAAGFTRVKIYRGSTREWNWLEVMATLDAGCACTAAESTTTTLDAVKQLAGHPGMTLLELLPKNSAAASAGTSDAPTAAGLTNVRRVPAADVIRAFAEITADDFKKVYGFDRPDKMQPLVVFAAGAGSAPEDEKLFLEAVSDLKALGYKRVRVLKLNDVCAEAACAECEAQPSHAALDVEVLQR